MSQPIAAIDLGTNTARLLIAEPLVGGGFRQLLLERRIVRLGGGFSKSEGLASDAIGRGLDCLHRFAELIRLNGVATVRGVATSAVRDAVNGQEFLRSVKSETGLTLRIIDGDLEGRLSLTGMLAGLDYKPEQIMLFDVGGGSTEYTVTDGASPLFISSLPLGVVRLTEIESDVAAMTDKIDHELEALQKQLADRQLSLAADALLVGTAGTATTLAAISLGMTEYDYRKVNNHTLTKQEIKRISDLLLPMSPEERLQTPGLEKGREDLIIAGALITLQTMERFGFASMKVSDYGLLEGLILSDFETF